MTGVSEAKETLKELISIPSPSGREKEVLLYIEERLKKLGIKPERQPVEGERFNLLYDNGSDFLISVHVDTVPPAGFRDAYKPTEKDGRIYGRGASDVKGAIASLLVALERFRRDFPNEDIPLSLAFVVDEETNSALGSLKLSQKGGKRRCLVLEPTYGLLCTKQMGAVEFSVRVRCKSAHGSEFEKFENPAGVFYEFLKSLERELKRPVNVIMLKSGSKLYAVPRELKALLEFKVYEGESAEELIKKLKKVAQSVRSGCSVEVSVEDREDFLSFRSDSLLPVLERALKKIGEEPKRGVMPSWTDASNYHRAGWDCVVFGFGSLADSHTDRESISVSELEKFVNFFYELMRELRGA
ncbi:MAG: M20/M25/M40 family metallo-hydrolase [Aquificae bacterium]|nr:M20/M25/M40 family metallo-hydrolase [Aquificota bacterium]